MGRINLLFELERRPPLFHDKREEVIRTAPPEPPPPPRPEAPLFNGEEKKSEWKKCGEKDKIPKPKCGLPRRIHEEEKKMDTKKEEKKEDRSEPGDDHVTEIYMDNDLYLAAKNGNLDGLKSSLDRVSAAESASPGAILSRLSPAGNTYLHIAAKHGNENIVNFIAAKEPSLVLTKNFKGETALHLAAKAGHDSTVTALVVQRSLPEDERDKNNLLKEKNKRGNTALHEALYNGRKSIAEYLIKEDPELSYYQNNDGESALYVAAKAGFVDCISLVLGLSTDELVNQLSKNKSPIQAAIQANHTDVLKVMFDTKPSLIQFRDGEGKNALHHAAWFGYLEIVRYLLNQCADSATERDRKGAFPIHWASRGGHVDVVRLLLKVCPDPVELLAMNGSNILHFAVMSGKSKIVNFILKNPDLKDLINMQDEQGNTPLHVAAMCFQPQIVMELTRDKRVNTSLANDRGMTALDATLHSNTNPPQYHQQLTWAALKAAGTPRSTSFKTVGIKSSSTDEDISNILLLVSILVATVTFAAGFTVPGGYNGPDYNNDVGMATMLRDKGFHLFVFCDMIAMYSSIIVAVALIWAQLGDLNLLLNALTLAVPFLGLALCMMSMAFTAGIFIVVSKLRWLSIAVLVLGINFFILFTLLFLPFCIPLTSRNWILRSLSYYPFRLLVLASSKRLAV